MIRRTPRDEKKKEHHFDYLYPEGLKPVVSKPHEYKLTSSRSSLALRATVIKKSSLGPASPLDHIIWDEMVQKNDSGIIQCDSVTLWTKDIEFNLLVFGTNDVAKEVRCAYFSAPEEEVCEKHIAYWKQIFRPWQRAKVGLMTKSARRLNANARSVKKRLPEIVVYNRYKINKKTEVEGSFERIHIFASDPFRSCLQSIPLPTNFLQDNTPIYFDKNCRSAFERLYRTILSRYECVAGCGSAMQRNLSTLNSLLVDKSIKAALVTGEPGTGKENLCKAIYYGNKLARPELEKAESLFIETTAVDIQSEMISSKITPGEILRKKINDRFSGQLTRKTKPNSPVIFIDELNKAQPEFLGAMLRPLEQATRELGAEGSPVYILAASQHIDDLAQKPPQDFWTRISHQLRVVHPLSRVSEEDGEAFLKSLFYSQWWVLVKNMIENYKDSEQSNLLEHFIGRVNRRKFQPSLLCEYVEVDFLNSLVPLVSRDTLSIRGARSILSQVFARLRWHVRFQKPIGKNSDSAFSKQRDINIKNEVARLVNSAIQDVMAILNAARSTPAGMTKKSQQI